MKELKRLLGVGVTVCGWGKISVPSGSGEGKSCSSVWRKGVTFCG